MANKNVEPPNNAATPVNGTSDSCFLKLYLENNGPMNDINQLTKVGVFNGQDIAVLAHYLSFE